MDKQRQAVAGVRVCERQGRLRSTSPALKFRKGSARSTIDELAPQLKVRLSLERYLIDAARDHRILSNSPSTYQAVSRYMERIYFGQETAIDLYSRVEMK